MASPPPAPDRPTSAHEALRRATRDSHQRVETSDFGRDLSRGRLGPGPYACWLACLRHLHGAVEGRLAASDDPRVVRVREVVAPRVPGLDADLAALAALAGPLDLGPAERAWLALDRAALAALDGPALLGALYTLEGSALGGQAILPQLRAAGAVPEQALGYYAGQGLATRAHFARLTGRLDEVLTAPDDLEAAGLGARWLFDLVGALFASLGASSR